MHKPGYPPHLTKNAALFTKKISEYYSCVSVQNYKFIEKHLGCYAGALVSFIPALVKEIRTPA
ncbi:hypothetical protein PGB90_005814 [Kerria lacca]